MTRYPDLFTELCAEFSPHEIKQRKQAGRVMDYVTARTVMNRLDEVLGPENWHDEYTPGEHSVLCKLTIILPDGSKLTKCDAGGYAGMADEGDDDKSGYSDAFKRAAVKFGVGRHLYKDGVPCFQPAREVDDTRPKVRALDRKIKDLLESADAHLNSDPSVPPRSLPIKDSDVLRHLYLWAEELQLLMPGTHKPETLKACRFLLNDLFDELPEAKRLDLLSEMSRFVTKKLVEAFGS